MAARFWNKQNASANWNATAPTNWGSASGVADGASVPGVGDTATFDGAGVGGNAASTISATISCLSLTFTSGYTQTVTINNTLTIAGNFTDHTAHSWAGTSGIVISAASTITSNGKTWPNAVNFTGANTKTLVGDWVITGLLTNSNAATVLNRTTAETLSVAGGLTNTQLLSGTATIILTGGTWSGTGVIQSSITFAGNVTISGSVSKNAGTVTYTSGTITTTSSTITVAASTTWDTSGISWNNITFSATGTHTINSLLTVNGTMQIAQGATITFAGAAGFLVATFNAINTTAVTLTFKNSVTYTVTGSFFCYLAPNSGPSTITSDDGTLLTTIILRDTTTVCCTNASFRRVDAGGGRPIVTFLGTLTTTINCYRANNFLFRPMESFRRSGNRLKLLNKDKAVIYN